MGNNIPQKNCGNVDVDHNNKTEDYLLNKQECLEGR